MKTIPLRMLIRETRKVKRMTRASEPVLVTDNGRPLWILRPAEDTAASEARRRREIDKILDDVRREKPSKISVSKILLESRR